MKVAAAFSLLAATAYAAAAPTLYTLSTKSPVASFNGLYLNVKNGKVAAYAGSRESAAVAGKFFVTPYLNTGTDSMHFGDEASQISLLGNQDPITAFMNIVDLRSPTASSTNGRAQWSTWVIGPNGLVTTQDGGNIPSRKWVAYLDTDGTYQVALWDGYTKQNRAVQVVQLVATPVDATKRT